MPKALQKPDPEKSLQNSAELEKPFTPTKAMIKWLLATEKLGPLASITDIAKEAHLDRDNWYQWLDRDEFVEWWESVWNKALKLNKFKLDVIGLRKANDSFDYFQLMQKRVGNIASEQSNPQTLIQQNFTDSLTPEQKARLHGQ